MKKPNRGPLVLNQYLPYQLVNLARRVSDACNAEYGLPYGISVAEWRILARLSQKIDGRLSEVHSRGLGDITFMDKSRVSRALQQLQGKGYLARRPDPADNRASFLSLTETGLALYQQIEPLALDWETHFLAALKGSEYRDLQRVISKLEAQLDTMPGPGDEAC
jgi:DNA-binding MarR family transcriptional regulator